MTEKKEARPTWRGKARVNVPQGLRKNLPEIAAMLANESAMPRNEFKELVQKYGVVLFEALLQQGTARPVICPHCDKSFEVLIRDTAALKFLMEQGYGKAQQNKAIRLDDRRHASDPSNWTDKELDEFLDGADEGDEGQAGEGVEGEGVPPLQGGPGSLSN